MKNGRCRTPNLRRTLCPLYWLRRLSTTTEKDSFLNLTRTHRGLNRCLALLHAAAWMLPLAAPTFASERDICENTSGTELVRCIEASVRGAPDTATRPAREGRPAKVTSPPVPAVSERVPRSPPPTLAEDCTGRTGEGLRRCLAAGGRLSPSAAVVDRDTPPAPVAPASDACEGKTGDELKTCVELSAKRATATKRVSAQPQTLVCTGYTGADQPLCVHRNTAIMECRNREKYPDHDVCLRSLMSQAPVPRVADCGILQGRARAHCEARNRAFQPCTGDKLGYFACLEHRLGADAVLIRR